MLFFTLSQVRVSVSQRFKKKRRSLYIIQILRKLEALQRVIMGKTLSALSPSQLESGINTLIDSCLGALEDGLQYNIFMRNDLLLVVSLLQELFILQKNKSKVDVSVLLATVTTYKAFLIVLG